MAWYSRGTFRVLTWLITSSVCIAAESKILSPKEKFHQDLIAKSPKSEELHWDYANWLYLQDRLDDSFKESQEVLNLNPHHDQALKLRANIQTLLSIKNPDARKKKKLELINRDLDAQMAVLQATLATSNAESSTTHASYEAKKHKGGSLYWKSIPPF